MMMKKFKFAKKNGEKTLERTRSSSMVVPQAFELTTPGLRVRVLTFWPLRHLVVSKAKTDS